MGNTLEIVNNFYETVKQKDLSQMKDFLDPNFKFVGPLDQTSTANDFLELNKQFLPLLEEVKMFRQFESGNEVCSIYDFRIKLPTGDKLTLSISDWIQVSNGKMIQEKIYYDARALAKAMGR